MSKGPTINGKEIPEFGNYWKCDIEENGIVYNSVEQYYQAHRCADANDFIRILDAPTPVRSAYLGSKVRNQRPDWGEGRYFVLEHAVRLKFKQHPELMKMLHQTGGHKIVFMNNNIVQDARDVVMGYVLTEIRKGNV